MKNIWALELSLCGEAGPAGQQQHPQHLRTFQRRFHRRNHRHGQGLSLTVWMQESSSSLSERFGLSSLRGSKCSPWGFSEGQGFDWCRDAAPVEVGIILGGQAGHGWRFWGVATSLGGISSPWHSISGWSSLPAPQTFLNPLTGFGLLRVLSAFLAGLLIEGNQCPAKGSRKSIQKCFLLVLPRECELVIQSSCVYQRKKFQSKIHMDVGSVTAGMGTHRGTKNNIKSPHEA